MCLQLTLMKFIAALEKVHHRTMDFQFTASMMQSDAVLTTESLCCMIIIIYNIISPLPHLLFARGLAQNNVNILIQEDPFFYRIYNDSLSLSLSLYTRSRNTSAVCVPGLGFPLHLP